jgi:hypothetical protein
MMQIVIPTRGRTEEQLTWTFFPKSIMERTTVVCPQREVNKLKSFRDNLNVEAQPDPNMKIAAKRAWILEEWRRRGYDKILMLDDDLRFATRISDGDWHLRPITGDELIPEFQKLEDKLGQDFPHVGFGQRQGNNTIEVPGWKVPGKMTYALGYYLPIVLEECNLNLVELREDMAISLQLLLKGYPNAILTETVVDQREFSRGGGCAAERTMEISNLEADLLANLFPGYVSVTEKKYKSSVPRKEVIVQWQKALQHGLSQRSKQAS